MVAPQPDAALFFEFAQRRVQQVDIRRVAPSARKRPLPRPRIALPLRAPHQEDGFRRSARMHDRHRCFRFRHLLNYIYPAMRAPVGVYSLPT